MKVAVLGAGGKGGSEITRELVSRGHEVVAIGRNAAVAHVGGFAFSGFFAWVAWLVLHIVLLIGFRNRLVVLINWAWAYLTLSSGARLITGDIELEPERPVPAAAARTG